MKIEMFKSRHLCVTEQDGEDGFNVLAVADDVAVLWLCQFTLSADHLSPLFPPL